MHLFLYGVLREGLGDWPFLDGLGAGRPATARGAMIAIPDPAGWYPALLPGDDLIHGALHPLGSVDLAAIDGFEGADYRRAPIAVRVGEAALAAEAYLWAAPVPPAAEPVPHGDFACWLSETGRTSFAPR